MFTCFIVDILTGTNINVGLMPHTDTHTHTVYLQSPLPVD